MRDVIAHQLGLAEDSFEIEVVPILPTIYQTEVDAP